MLCGFTQDAYRFAGLHPLATVRGMFGDPKARIIVQVRRRKKRHAASVDDGAAVFTTGDAGSCGTSRAPTFASIWTWKCAASRAGAVRP